MQLTVNKTNKHAQRESSKTSGPFTFCSKIRKWENVTVDEMYVVLAMFILKGTVQKLTLRSRYSKNCLLFTPFFLKNLPLKRLKLIAKIHLPFRQP